MKLIPILVTLVGLSISNISEITMNRPEHQVLMSNHQHNPTNNPQPIITFQNSIIRAGLMEAVSVENMGITDDISVLSKPDGFNVLILNLYNGSHSIFISRKNKQEGDFRISFKCDALNENGQQPVELFCICVHSDGKFDSYSSISETDARSNYYLEYLASEEDLILLGKKDMPESFFTERTVEEAKRDYLNYINNYVDGARYDFSTSIDKNLGSKIRLFVKVNIYSKDEKRYIPLKGVTVRFMEHSDELNAETSWNDDDDSYTDENGEYYYDFGNKEWYNAHIQPNGSHTYIYPKILCETNACVVKSTHDGDVYNVFPEYALPKAEHDGQIFEYEFFIDPTFGSDILEAFNICDIVQKSHDYACEMSNGYTEPVTIWYPNKEIHEPGSYYDTNKKEIYISKKHCLNFDVVTHEYCHSLIDWFNLGFNIGEEHKIDENLIDKYNFLTGSMLAWSEGLATYLTIATKMYNKPRDKRNMIYFSDVDSIYVDFDLYGYGSPTMDGKGEGNEMSVASLLIKLLDSNPREGDKIKFGHKKMWELLFYKNAIRYNATSFISYVYGQYPDMQQELGTLLAKENFAPSFNQDNVILSTDSSSSCWSFSWDFIGNTPVNPDLYKLYFYGDEGEQISILVGKSNSYTLSEKQMNAILAFKSERVICSLEYSINGIPFTCSFPGACIILQKPECTSIYPDETFQGEVPSKGHTWFKMTAPYTATYTFECISRFDSFGEIFPKMVVGRSNDEMIISDDDGSGDNFLITMNLQKNETIYLRVHASNYDSTNYGQFTLNVTHEHSFVDGYVPYSNKYHIAFCGCGESILEAHTGGPLIGSGPNAYRRCTKCGQILSGDAIYHD